MAINSKNKGARFERELASRFRDYGYSESRRTAQFCGNTGEWLGKVMPLELDHINGKNNDHRIENLRWLCPNCHAITDTYSGRNNKEN